MQISLAYNKTTAADCIIALFDSNFGTIWQKTISGPAGTQGKISEIFNSQASSMRLQITCNDVTISNLKVEPKEKFNGMKTVELDLSAVSNPTLQSGIRYLLKPDENNNLNNRVILEKGVDQSKISIVDAYFKAGEFPIIINITPPDNINGVGGMILNYPGQWVDLYFGDSEWKTTDASESPDIEAVQVTNNVNTAINSVTAATGTVFNSWDVSSALETASYLYTLSDDGITINRSGVYKVTVSIFQTASNQRTNAAVFLSVDGVDQLPMGAGGYIRSSAGHNESSVNITQLLQITDGQKVSVKTRRMAGAGTVTAPEGTALFIIERVK